MRLGAVWGIVVMFCAIPAGAFAQALGTASSSGLTANVVGIAYAQGEVSVEVVIKNTSNTRIYIQDARTDGSQEAFLGSGVRLNGPMPNGMPFCNESYAQCVTGNTNTAISLFSYIDPGSSLGVSMRYNASQPPSNPDTISFSITMMARFAKSEDDNSPGDAGPVQEITLPFAFLSFSQKD